MPRRDELVRLQLGKGDKNKIPASRAVPLLGRTRAINVMQH